MTLSPKSDVHPRLSWSADSAAAGQTGICGLRHGSRATRPKQPNKHDELRLLINSRRPIITVETPEEEAAAERLEALLMDAATELGVPL